MELLYFLWSHLSLAMSHIAFDDTMHQEVCSFDPIFYIMVFIEDQIIPTENSNVNNNNKTLLLLKT